MKNRKLVISDIHGCYDEFNKLLGKVNYNSVKDQLILLGDYIDRGKDSQKVVKFVRELVEIYGAIALKGNHEDMLKQWVKKPVELMQWYFQNGGIETLESYIPDLNKDVWCWDTYVKWRDELLLQHGDDIDFLFDLPYYHEDDVHIYVHAGINPFLEDWKQGKKEEFIWIREPFLNSDHMQNKTVIHGHTPTVNYQDTGDIIFGRNKINVDGGYVFGYQLNCLVITDDGYEEYSVMRNKLT